MKKTIKSEGFGFTPEESGHHFIVIVPPNGKTPVYISEHMTPDNSWRDSGSDKVLSENDKSLRVLLSLEQWTKIEKATMTEFNKRLRKENKKISSWKTGMNILNRNLGKELVLLCWAIEDADPALIPTAIQNWLGLAPEERWWLYTMTNAASGHVTTGKNKGWRRAVRYALTENPVSSRVEEEHVNLLDIFMESSSLVEEPKTSKKKSFELERKLPENIELTNDL